MKYTITPTNIRPLTTMAVDIVYKQVPIGMDMGTVPCVLTWSVLWGRGQNRW